MPSSSTGRGLPALGSLGISLALALALALVAGGHAAAMAEPGQPMVYFAETGHTVGGKFLWTFQRLGGLDRFGYPRTEALMENGRRVQYFQRAVLEHFPEHAGTPYEVQLRLLGSDLAGEVSALARVPISQSAAPADGRYFPETRHSVRGLFLTYFDRHGGLYSFGYPVSEPYDQDGLWVQYFQRARFEHHPGNPAAYRVQLGLLGDEWIGTTWRVGDERLAPVPRPVLAEVEWARGRISIGSSSGPGRYNAGIAVRWLDGARIAPGQRLSFDDTVRSWDGREDPAYLVSKGTSCEGGLVTMRGGGVCYVSTALWRAWMEAGLKTVLRVSHSGELDDFGAGYDAANTLIVENDSPANLRLSVELVGDEVTVRVVGDRPPDRLATIEGPHREGVGRYVVYQRVERLGGPSTRAAFRSYYCW